MEWFSAKAATYQKTDEQKCAKYLKIAADLAVEVAPYCHPTLKAGDHS